MRWFSAEFRFADPFISKRSAPHKSKDNVVSLTAPAAGATDDPQTDLLRRNARRLVEVAVTAEFEGYLSAFSEERVPDARRRMVRNGYLPARQILTGIGAAVRAPLRESGRGDFVAVFAGDFGRGHA